MHTHPIPIICKEFSEQFKFTLAEAILMIEINFSKIPALRQFILILLHVSRMEQFDFRPPAFHSKSQSVARSNLISIKIFTSDSLPKTFR